MRVSPCWPAAFSRITFRRHPSAATDLGVHKYDAAMDDASRPAIAAEVTALGGLSDCAHGDKSATLSPSQQLDREQLIHAMQAGILADDVIRRWVKDQISTAPASRMRLTRS